MMTDGWIDHRNYFCYVIFVQIELYHVHNVDVLFCRGYSDVVSSQGGLFRPGPSTPIRGTIGKILWLSQWALVRVFKWQYLQCFPSRFQYQCLLQMFSSTCMSLLEVISLFLLYAWSFQPLLLQFQIVHTLKIVLF